MTENEYPGVKHAYEYARSSYGHFFHRLDAVEGRIQALMVFASSVTLGVITLALTVPETPPATDSIWLWTAGVTYLLVIGPGLWGQTVGNLRLISPEVLWQRSLRWDEWEFKKNMLDRSRDDFADNLRIINEKWCYYRHMNAAFAVEVVLLLVWVVTGLR